MPTPLVKIDSTTVEAVPGTLNATWSIGNRAAISVDVISTSGAYRPTVGKTIEIFENATKLWAGSVDEVEEWSISEASPTGRRYSIRGVSWEQLLDKRYCFNPATGRPLRYSRNYEFTADAGTDVVTTTVAHGRSNGDKVRVRAHANGALCGGLSTSIEYFVISATTYTLKLSLTAGGSAVNITDTGTLEQILITYRAGEIVVAILSDGASSEPLGSSNVDLGAVIDAIIFGADLTVSGAIAQLAEASNYVWWIDEERELYFKPRTFEAAPFSIGDATGNYRNFSVRRTREDKCNAAMVQVDIEQIGYEDETFAGDGSAVKWTLAYPVGQMVKIQVNDEDKEFAVWLTESDRAYYYEPGDATIRQDSDEAVLTSSDTLRVAYRKFGANTLYVDDSTDIVATGTLEGGSGIYQQLFDRPGIGQVEAAAQGAVIVAARKANVTEVQYETDQQVESTCHTLRPGQLQTVANSYHDISSGSYLIREVSMRDVFGRWLAFSVKAIDSTRLGGSVDFWKALAGGGASGGNSGFVAGSTLGSGGGSTSIEQTLTANTTITSPYTPTSADLLSVQITQGAGPYTIAFDGAFDTVTPTNIPAKNGAKISFLFRGGSDSKWHLVAVPFGSGYD